MLTPTTTSYPVNLIESLDGMLGPASWRTGAPVWSTRIGTLAASVKDADGAPAGGRRVTGKISATLTLSTGSADEATILVARLNSAPGLGAAYVSHSVTSQIELISQIPLYDDSTSEERERLGFLLASAAITHLQLAAGCLGLPAVVKLPRRNDACAWTERELSETGWQLTCGRENVHVEARALYIGFSQKMASAGDVGCPKNTSIRFLGFCTHPWLGDGLADEISIGVDSPPELAAKLADELNEAQLHVAALPVLGAWSAEPDEGRLVYASFWPDVAHELHQLPKIASWQRERLRLVKRALAGRHPK